jgi:hypothetical protein
MLTHFPPTPKPKQAIKAPSAVKLLAPPAAIPKTPAINRVIWTPKGELLVAEV